MANDKILTAAKIRNIKDAGKYPDGNGLTLIVSKTGVHRWQLILRWTGGRSELSLGNLSLADARERAFDIRRLAKQGKNPKDWKKALEAPDTKGITFDDCIPLVMRKVGAELTNEKHIAQWTSTLKRYASPVIGHKPVELIDLDDIEQILLPIWKDKTETAMRLRGRIERVLSWAIVKKHRKPPNPAMWKGNLDMLLPSPEKIKKVKHHPALPYAELPAFMAELRLKSSRTARMLELLILTTSRTQEIQFATWSEFDFINKVWTIPPERMKAKKEHRVPLTARMIDVLNAIDRLDDYVFAGQKAGNPMSNMAMLTFLKRDMNKPDLTVHGFRSTFKDWCMEVSDHAGEVSEAQLAHTITNQAQAAYERGDKLAKRVALLNDWSAYCG